MPLAPGHVERYHDLPGLGFVQGVHPIAIKPGEPIFLSERCNHELVEESLRRFAEPNPLNVRSLFVVRDEYVVMHDDLDLAPEIPCRWHLQVVSDAHTGDARNGYLFEGRFGIDLQVLFPGQIFKEEKVERVPIHDFQAAVEEPAIVTDTELSYRERHRNMIRPQDECFAMSHLMVRSEQTDHYLAIVRPLTGNRRPVEARSLRVGGCTVGVAVEGEGIDDLVFLNREVFTYEMEGIRFQGRYGAVLRREASVQLYLLAGSVLEADGFCIRGSGAAVRLEAKADMVEITAEGFGRVEILGMESPLIFEVSGDRMNRAFPKP
jgi:hypothetical protein